MTAACNHSAILQEPHATSLGKRVWDIAAETLWPARCALCERPGNVLCEPCQKSLPFIDALEACPHCGAPYGRVQCTECNQVMLAPFGYEMPPYQQTASALLLTEPVHRVVTTYKDKGDRALARPMAALMARYVPPLWLMNGPALTYVPATTAARRRRGFDHGQLLARELSWLLQIDVAPLLATPRRKDQRTLARHGRIQNMRAAMQVIAGASVPEKIILTDDVCTTGATLFAATEALKAAGAREVYCLTFARA